MVRTLLGSETEYALTGILKNGATIDPDLLAHQAFALAREKHRHIANRESLFLENGARFYVDRGPHLEYATPECRDPWQAVRFIRAGERFVQGLAEDLPRQYRDLERVLVFRTNVDYSGSHASWANHESYLHQVAPQILPDQMIPHLVSRIVYAGAGGFDPTSSGLEFTLSPRTAFITQAVSVESTSDRGIFHAKNESLAQRPFHRLHVLCGETVCSDVAGLLKLGTTALITAAIDVGRRPGNEVRLKRPVEALHRFARDRSCSTRVETASGDLTAIAIQRHYLTEVEACRDQLPNWTDALCDLWHRHLDLLEQDPTLAARTLDWPLKWRLYERWLEGRPMLSDRLEVWNRVMAFINRQVRESADPPVHPATLPMVQRLLGKRGRTYEDVERFLALRAELLEIELRFGQLGPDGIFSSLATEVWSQHTLVSSDEIERAVTTPPADTRARLRGEFVTANGGPAERSQFLCDWEGLQDRKRNRRADLSDPFAVSGIWQESKWQESKPALEFELEIPGFIRRQMD